MKIKICLILACLLLGGKSVSGDTIYLQDSPKGNAGEVLEEYPDAIIIKFPKSEIKRIEADEKPPSNQSSSLQQVIWIDDGETITLRLPKQSVQVSGSEGLEIKGRGISGFVDKQPPPTPMESLQELSRLSKDRVIQGKVLMRGDPLPNCKIRILKAADSVRDRMLSMFSGSNEKEEEQSFEATTDEFGLYTFTNVPYGEYILYWKPEGNESWIRRLSENPDITLVPGRPVAVRDIETNVRTVN
jgi:hypothetical protein